MTTLIIIPSFVKTSHQHCSENVLSTIRLCQNRSAIKLTYFISKPSGSNYLKVESNK
jgi:hypothetical protein